MFKIVQYIQSQFWVFWNLWVTSALPAQSPRFSKGQHTIIQHGHLLYNNPPHGLGGARLNQDFNQLQGFE